MITLRKPLIRWPEMVRSRRFEVLRCLHAIDAHRLQERRSWVAFSILRPGRGALLRAGLGGYEGTMGNTP